MPELQHGSSSNDKSDVCTGVQPKAAKPLQLSPEDDPNTIHIFTVASGHMYERLQKIMILSVIRNTRYSFMHFGTIPSMQDWPDAAASVPSGTEGMEWRGALSAGRIEFTRNETSQCLNYLCCFPKAELAQCVREGQGCMVADIKAARVTGRGCIATSTSCNSMVVMCSMWGQSWSKFLCRGLHKAAVSEV